MGLPKNWENTEKWLFNTKEKKIKKRKQVNKKVKKCPEIPSLTKYTENPSEKFWEKFRSYKPSKKIQTRINTKNFENLICENWENFTTYEKKTATKALQTLRFGADPKLKKNLPSINCKNNSSTIKNGELVTDTIASWVKQKFVAGPFDTPPHKNFRTNPLIAVEQKSKIRPVLNLSAPKNRSYNDEIKPHILRKLKMSSAKLFGYAVKKAGKGAIMYKYDICDTYKLIPTAPSTWHHFGFNWLGKYFFDMTCVFGSKAAPENFDNIAETITNIARISSNSPKNSIHRTLDDVPIIAPKNSQIAEKFASKYKNICHSINVPLAENCPKFEKAFEKSTHGTVLGINFNTEKGSWRIPKEKAEDTLHLINQFQKAKTANLKQFQKLHGKLSDFGQMCPFTKGYRFHFTKYFQKFEGEKNTSKKLIPIELKNDLKIWENCIHKAKKGLPLPTPPTHPPLSAIHFISDAAGCPSDNTQTTTSKDYRGAASLGFKKDEYFFYGSITWPEKFILKEKNPDNTLYGHKSTTLETIGLLIPFLTIPKALEGRHIVLHVDNTATIASWQKKHCKQDTDTSILIRGLHIIESYLHCKIHVIHEKRMSTEAAILADHLSRSSTTSNEDKEKIKHLKKHEPEGALKIWLENPGWDWGLPNKLLQDVKDKNK